MTDRALTVPLGDLGPLGLKFAANLLEDHADAITHEVFFAQSLQLVADMLRTMAVQAAEIDAVSKEPPHGR